MHMQYMSILLYSSIHIQSSFTYTTSLKLFLKAGPRSMQVLKDSLLFLRGLLELGC